MRYISYDVDNLPDVIPGKMYEATLKELRAECLPQVRNRVKTQKLKTKLVKVDKKGVIHFTTTSGTYPYKTWNQEIILLDLEEAIRNRGSLKDKDIVNLAIFGNIKVHCNDDSFRYYWSYVAWVKGYGIYREVRYPKVRNPNLKGSICKHLALVLQVLPLHINQLVKMYRKVGIL